jgi:uncharacterized protein (DUF924 family)
MILRTQHHCSLIRFLLSKSHNAHYRLFCGTSRIPMDEVNKFWFSMDIASQFKKDPVLDREIADRFGHMVVKAKNGDYDNIVHIPENALGVIILLDQFTRNIYRDTPEAFSGDEKALATAKQSVEAGLDGSLNNIQKMFMYMPFMHSEKMEDQDSCIALNAKCGNPTDFGMKHKVIIERFGRFPHRNQALGRETTPEEAEFLTQPDSSF